jgi:hypothetical protein
MMDIDKLINRTLFRIWGLSPDLIAPKIHKLLHDYGIPPDLVQMETWMAATLNMGQMNPEWLKFPSKNYSESEQDDFAKLCYLENLKINRVEITAIGSPYVFEKDGHIKSLFESFLKSKANRKSLPFSRVGTLPPHRDAILIDEFLKPFQPTDRQRHLFIWQLYQLGGYPFTNQQLKAPDQNKASLISNWIKRNKNQKFTG